LRRSNDCAATKTQNGGQSDRNVPGENSLRDADFVAARTKLLSIRDVAELCIIEQRER